MHPFQDSLRAWFSRKLPEHAFNQCWEIPFVLSSDIGLVRKENQDRVAALHTGKKSVNPLFAIAVVDGMGGCVTEGFVLLWHSQDFSMH